VFHSFHLPLPRGRALCVQHGSSVESAEPRHSLPQAGAACFASASRIVGRHPNGTCATRGISVSCRSSATTFEMTREDLEGWRPNFQTPEVTELETADIDPPPAVFDCWEAWVAQYWPTSLPGYEPGRHVLD